MNYYQDKRILITGAASGMGRLMSIAMGSLGGKMILMDIDPTGLTRVKDELLKKNIKVSTHICDLALRDQVYNTASRYRKIFPRCSR